MVTKVGISQSIEHCKIPAKNDIRTWFHVKTQPSTAPLTIVSPSTTPSTPCESNQDCEESESTSELLHSPSLNTLSSSANTASSNTSTNLSKRKKRTENTKLRENSSTNTKSYLLTPPIPFQTYLRTMGRKNPNPSTGK